MTKTRVPAIPAPTEANLREVARALKVLADIREGVTGDPLDRFVTFRDLGDGGVASVSLSGGRVSGIRPSAPIAGPGYDPTEDLTTPPQPTGVTATGAFASVILSWDGLPSGYINHAYAEIWRADTNVIGDSVLIGTTSSTRFVDFIGNSATRYYWVRFVSQANVIGAYHGISGAAGTTSEDPELLLDALTGQITENQLYQDLGARIDLIDGSGAGSVNARIAEESFARSLADATLTGAIDAEETARALADDITGAALAAAGVQAGQTSAALQTVSTTQASGDSALASQVTTLQSTVGGNTVAIQAEALTRASETGGLFAKYGIKIDNAGHVSGFGLLSTNNDATPTSEFGIRADKFWIAGASTASNTAPTTNLYRGRVWLDTSVTPNVTRYYTGSAWSTTPQTLPFSVLAAPGTINGVSVPAGVYIDTAFIADATITRAKIADLAVDNAKIANLDASKITTGQLTAQFIDGTDLQINAAGVELGKDVGPGDGHYGLSLSGDNFNNIFLRRNDGVVFFRINEGGAQSLTFDSESGLLNVRGSVNGGDFTGYAWPAAGGSGFHLGPNGLLLGNYNTVLPDGRRRYLEIGSNGNIFAPGLTIVDGNATFAGELAANTVATNMIKGGAVSKVVEFTWTWTGDNGDETFLRYLDMPSGGTVHYILVTQVYSTGYSGDDTMNSDINFNGIMLDGIYASGTATGYPAVLITSVIVSGPGVVNWGGRLRWSNVAGGSAKARGLVLVTYR